MLTQGVDVLLVAPHNGKSAAVIVEAAHKAGVPVIAYDRLINDADVDLYLSFDNERVGQMQAEYLVQRRPKGSYVVIGGAPTDNNAHLYHKGQMNVLEPLVKRGEIRIVADQWARDWLAVEALKIMENALTRTANQVDAVVAANDGVAGGAIQALSEQNLAGRTPSQPGRGSRPAGGSRLNAEHDRLQADPAARLRAAEVAVSSRAAAARRGRRSVTTSSTCRHPARAVIVDRRQPRLDRHRRCVQKARRHRSLPREPSPETVTARSQG
jgi:D-xylose transport system substrate-binding protein